jgi:hypothetical protein
MHEKYAANIKWSRRKSPHKKSPIEFKYRGFSFYSLLTAPGASLRCKVELRYEADCND